MSIGGGVAPQQPDWQQELNEFEGKIERLRRDPSPQQTARVRNSVNSVLRALGQTTSATSPANDVPALRNRCSTLQEHLAILEGQCKDSKLFGIRAGGSFHASRIFGSSTKRSVQEACKEIKKIVKQTLFTIATDGIVNPTPKLKKEIKGIQDPCHMQIVLACSKNSCLGSSDQERIALLSQIRKIPSIENLDKHTIDLAIGVIPQNERSPKNIALFINAISEIPIHERSTFITNLGNIPSANRVYTLQSVVDFLSMTGWGSDLKIKDLLLAIKNGGTGLHLAVNLGSLKILQDLLSKAGRSINIQDKLGQTALYYAVSNKHIKQIELLIKAGADCMIRDIYGITPYANYKMKGIEVPHCLTKQPDEAGYRLKMAALIWGLDGKGSLEEGKEFELAGGDISVPLSEEIGKLSCLPGPVRDAFSEVKGERSAKEMAKSIRNGKLTVIPIGFIKHAMSLVFYQDMVFVCNRGEGAEGRALRCFQIDPKKITPLEIEKLLSMKSKSKEEALKYYHELLPASLTKEGVPVEITSKFSSIKPKLQSTGNCSAASIKLAMRAALAALSYKANQNDLPAHVAEEVRATSKKATHELRKRSYAALEAALDPSVKERVLGYFANKKEKYSDETPSDSDPLNFMMSQLESQIEGLRINSTSSQTAHVRSTIDSLIKSVKALSTTGLEPAKLLEQYRQLNGHLSTLKKQSEDNGVFGRYAGGGLHFLRLFRNSSTKTAVERLSLELKKAMNNHFIALAANAITGDGKSTITTALDSLLPADRMKVALVCSTPVYQSGNRAKRLELINAAKTQFPLESQYQEASILLGLIPLAEQSIGNMKLVLESMKGLSVRERQSYVEVIKIIPLEFRMGIFKTYSSYSGMIRDANSQENVKNVFEFLSPIISMNDQERGEFIQALQRITSPENRVSILQNSLLLLTLVNFSNRKDWLLHALKVNLTALQVVADLVIETSDWQLLKRFLKLPGVNVKDANGLSPYLQLRMAGVPADKLEFLASDEESYHLQISPVANPVSSNINPVNREQILEMDFVEAIRSGSFDNAFNLIETLNLDPGRTQNQQNKAYLMVGLAALVAGNNVEVEKALSLMTNGPEKTKFNRYKTYGSEVLSRYLDQDLEDGPFKVYINSISANSGSAQGVNGELSDAIANKDYQKAIGMIGDNTPQKDDVLFWMALAAR